jgi:anti-sigma regulatory factor (Ser/Thr protein kinase)
MSRIADLKLGPSQRATAYDDVVLPGALLPLWPVSAQQELRAHVELPVAELSVAAARHVASAWVESWRSRALPSDVVLVVSELATNAVLAAQAAGIVDGVVVLSLEALAGGGVQVDVWDPAPSPEAIGALDADDQAEGGRGLMLVQALAKAWELVKVPVGTQVRAVLGAVA